MDFHIKLAQKHYCVRTHHFHQEITAGEYLMQHMFKVNLFLRGELYGELWTSPYISLFSSVLIIKTRSHYQLALKPGVNMMQFCLSEVSSHSVSLSLGP